jgi:adenylyltransferase/sulfurtransferase
LLASIVIRQFLLGKKLPHYEAREVATKLRSNTPPILLDVRSAGENRRGHINGSLNIPVHELSKRLPELEKYRGREIVVYCNTGPRSLHGAHLLQQKGFNVVNLRGGMSAWRALKKENT